MPIRRQWALSEQELNVYLAHNLPASFSRWRFSSEACTNTQVWSSRASCRHTARRVDGRGLKRTDCKISRLASKSQKQSFEKHQTRTEKSPDLQKVQELECSVSLSGGNLIIKGKINVWQVQYSAKAAQSDVCKNECWFLSTMCSSGSVLRLLPDRPSRGFYPTPTFSSNLVESKTSTCKTHHQQSILPSQPWQCNCPTFLMWRKYWIKVC